MMAGYSRAHAETKWDAKPGEPGIQTQIAGISRIRLCPGRDVGPCDPCLTQFLFFSQHAVGPAEQTSGTECLFGFRRRPLRSFVSSALPALAPGRRSGRSVPASGYLMTIGNRTRERNAQRSRRPRRGEAASRKDREGRMRAGQQDVPSGDLCKDWGCTSHNPPWRFPMDRGRPSVVCSRQ